MAAARSGRRGIAAVTLDATGTLFRPREAIGTTYLKHVVAVCGPPPAPASGSYEAEITAAFKHSFRAELAASPNFGRVDSAATAQPWWGRVIFATFPPALQAHVGSRKDELLATLYSHYATRAAWEVFDDVHPALRSLQERGVPMGVVSNFDERLESILETLDLRGYFDFVLTSWDHGVAKPDASIFHRAAELHGITDVDGRGMLHIGDDATNDLFGARAAGYSGGLVDRSRQVTLTQLLQEH
ncbi:hypothetical protein SDRG_13652 [Saprolegnia diclina VS20]|uniref:Haloacid dehalogenase, type II n=1 Tax=Saprolegnia diclina (strain VS20) TaxID=1156394 RepID=T0Q575_SAPDV|nr:hypothetical protein SDRG_13652 [Saprolegnia diclina VS20]EQC28575.1 hypothetical protein SDRG_13652 [Saprolegnia diclina VS20]|eukprot:XP_008617972.1 hypothetical protein SDRG_13652 [Saprolegnia diclina VS20]